MGVYLDLRQTQLKNSNPLKINQLDLSRVILGSDQNRLSKKENINSKFDEGFCYINSDRNIKRLFNI